MHNITEVYLVILPIDFIFTEVYNKDNKRYKKTTKYFIKRRMSNEKI